MDYEKLLERGLKKVPKDLDQGSRFNVAKPDVEKAGAKTIIANFFEISGSLRRDPEDIVKFLLKQLATKGELEGQRLVVQGNFSQDMIDKKIDIYIKSYVICSECGKPDTKIVAEGTVHYLKCEACGAKKQIPKV